MQKHLSRRDVLQLGVAAGLSAGLSRSALGQGKPKPIRAGVIGVGARGTHHVRLALSAGIEIPAICDIKEAHLNRAIDLVEKARPGAKPGWTTNRWICGPKSSICCKPLLKTRVWL